MASESQTRHRTRGELRARAEHSGAAGFFIPVQRYVQHLVVAGAAMLAGAVIGLGWANLHPDSYHGFWETPFRVQLGTLALRLDFHGLAVDGLMAIFFLLAALEVKRELVVGELADRRRAAFPLFTAVGGIVVPAGLFIGINLVLPDGRPGAWGIPVATDIAFSMGVLALLGPAGPIRTLLLSMAVADDIAGILIIAVVYAGELALGPLLLAALLLALAWGMVRVGVGAATAFIVIGVLLWLALHAGGIHPTIAGVAMALIVPMRPSRSSKAAVDDIAATIERTDFTDDTPEEVDAESQQALGRITAVAASSESPGDRISRLVMPWVRFVVLPLFAIAAAGVEIPFDRIGEAAVSPIGLGIVASLAVGKPVGILATAWIAQRTGIGEAPEGLGWHGIVGVGLLAGIGFTVSLFITNLAITDGADARIATLGVLVASLLSAAAAMLWLGPLRRRE